jgi:hypothetical protein
MLLGGSCEAVWLVGVRRGKTSVKWADAKRISLPYFHDKWERQKHERKMKTSREKEEPPHPSSFSGRS